MSVRERTSSRVKPMKPPGTADVAGMNNNGGTINLPRGHISNRRYVRPMGRRMFRQADFRFCRTFRRCPECLRRCGFFVRHSSKGDIKVAGTLAADVLITSSDVQLNIGDQGSAGRVVARQAQLQGRQGIP